MYYWNRFDIVEAYYVYMTRYGRGDAQVTPRDSGRKRRIAQQLGRAGLWFRPGLSVREYGYKGLTCNGQAIYRDLLNRPKGGRNELR